MLPDTVNSTMLLVSNTFLSAAQSERLSKLGADDRSRGDASSAARCLQIRAEQLAFASAMCQIWLYPLYI